MIPASHRYDQTTLAQMIEDDPVVAGNRSFFSLLDWSIVQRWQTQRSFRGRPGHPMGAYIKACLVRIKEGLLNALLCCLEAHTL
jgi:hypothetical protein